MAFRRSGVRFPSAPPGVSVVCECIFRGWLARAVRRGPQAPSALRPHAIPPKCAMRRLEDLRVLVERLLADTRLSGDQFRTERNSPHLPSQMKTESRDDRHTSRRTLADSIEVSRVSSAANPCCLSSLSKTSSVVPCKPRSHTSRMSGMLGAGDIRKTLANPRPVASSRQIPTRSASTIPSRSAPRPARDQASCYAIRPPPG